MENLSAERADAKLLRFDQSGALLRKVAQTAAIGMAIVGIDGRIVYANRAYEVMLGCDPDAVLGQSNADLLSAEDRDLMNLRFGQLARGEVEDFQTECRMIHHDGGTLWVLMTATLLRSETTTRPLHVVVQIVNIDRQKRAEDALARSESLWNFALESAGQGVWDCDVPSNRMVYSRVWRKMRGIPEDEIIDPSQSAWLARVHPDDVERVLSASRQQGHGADGFDTLEYRERHRDGHYIWILSRGRPVEWDAAGNPLRSVGTDTDITRLKIAEAQVAEEKERLRITLESIGEGVISTDAQSRVLFMNPVAEGLTGWDKNEALGRALPEVFATRLEATGASAKDVIAECLALGGPREIDDGAILAARHGTERGVSGTASPVKDANGRTIGAVLVFKDVTDLQEVRRQLTHSANHDALTGLPNRSAFERALSECARAENPGRQSSALCFIDLDRFKPVNDTAGHAAGDELLKIVARTIAASCRAQDFAARLGGDEFVVLLVACPIKNAERRRTEHRYGDRCHRLRMERPALFDRRLGGRCVDRHGFRRRGSRPRRCRLLRRQGERPQSRGRRELTRCPRARGDYGPSCRELRTAPPSEQECRRRHEAAARVVGLARIDLLLVAEPDCDGWRERHTECCAESQGFLGIAIGDAIRRGFPADLREGVEGGPHRWIEIARDVAFKPEQRCLAHHRMGHRGVRVVPEDLHRRHDLKGCQLRVEI